MSKFVRIKEARMKEPFWFSSSCAALVEQIGHIYKTREIALNFFVKGFNRGMNPAFQPFSRISVQFQRHFDPFYESVT